MATKNWSIIHSLQQGTKGLVVYKWSLTNGDDGKPIDGGQYADKTVQIYGTFGSGGNVVIEGSNDSESGATYAALNDPQGNVLNIGSAKIEAILENPRLVRPRVTAGDGNTDLSVIIAAKK